MIDALLHFDRFWGELLCWCVRTHRDPCVFLSTTSPPRGAVSITNASFCGVKKKMGCQGLSFTSRQCSCCDGGPRYIILLISWLQILTVHILYDVVKRVRLRTPHPRTPLIPHKDDEEFPIPNSQRVATAAAVKFASVRILGVSIFMFVTCAS